MKNRFIDSIWPVFLWLLFAGILVSIFFYSYNRKFDRDEFENIHTAWKIKEGQKIFVDFFQHHHPFFDYMLTPVVSAYGSTVDTLFVSRYIMLVITACALAVTYLLAMRIFKNAEIGVLSLILTSTFIAFYQKSIEIRPDVPQMLTALLAIYFLFTYYDKRSLRSLIGSALFLAISFLFLQKTFVLVITIGGLLVYDTLKRNVPFRYAALYGGVFVAALMPYYIYMAIDGSLERYFKMNWLVNYYMSQGLGKLGSTAVLISENIVTCVFYAVGVIALLGSVRERRFVVFTICLIVLTIMTFQNLWKQYFMSTIPLVAMIAGYAIYISFSNRLSRLAIIFGAIFMPLVYMHDKGFFNMNVEKQRAQLDKVEYVLSITEEGDKVYDGDSLFNLYRDDIDYFWFCHPCVSAYKKISDYRYDIYELIAYEKPKVISNTGIHNFDDVRIKNRYKVSDRYPDLYLRVD